MTARIDQATDEAFNALYTATATLTDSLDDLDGLLSLGPLEAPSGLLASVFQPTGDVTEPGSLPSVSDTALDDAGGLLGGAGLGDLGDLDHSGLL